MSDKIETINQDISGFKITRTINGQAVKIEITEDELFHASLYYEDVCYREDINGLLEDMEDDDGENEREDLYGYTVNEIRADESLMENICSKYRKYRNNYDTEWRDTAYDAVKDTLSEIKSNLKE